MTRKGVPTAARRLPPARDALCLPNGQCIGRNHELVVQRLDVLAGAGERAAFQPSEWRASCLHGPSMLTGAGADCCPPGLNTSYQLRIDAKIERK